MKNSLKVLKMGSILSAVLLTMLPTMCRGETGSFTEVPGYATETDVNIGIYFNNTNIKDSDMMQDSEVETTRWKNKLLNVVNGGFIILPDRPDQFYEIFKDEESINIFLKEMGTFYGYLGETGENMIGLYVNIIDHEAGVCIVSNSVDILLDDDTKFRPMSYSFFVGRAISPIKSDKPENVESKTTHRNPGDKAEDIFRSAKDSIERDYGNIGLRADIGDDSYLTAKYNPFINEASTYLKIKRTFYNEDSGKIADVSLKGVATYYIAEQVWSAKVSAQVKVPLWIP